VVFNSHQCIAYQLQFYYWYQDLCSTICGGIFNLKFFRYVYEANTGTFFVLPKRWSAFGASSGCSYRKAMLRNATPNLFLIQVDFENFSNIVDLETIVSNTDNKINQQNMVRLV
jgi:hypothetical protein